MKFSDRDLVVVMIIIVVGAALSTADWFLDIKPQGVDGVLNAALLIGALWWVYQVGKSSS